MVGRDVLQHVLESGASIAVLLRIARGHLLLLPWLREADAPKRAPKLLNEVLAGALSDEEVSAAYGAAGGDLLDVQVIDGPGRDRGTVRVGVSR